MNTLIHYLVFQFLLQAICGISSEADKSSIQDILYNVYHPWFPYREGKDIAQTVAEAVKRGDKGFLLRTFDADLSDMRLKAPLISQALSIESLRQGRWDMYRWLTVSLESHSYSYQSSFFMGKLDYIGDPSRGVSYEYAAMLACLEDIESPARNIGLFLLSVLEACVEETKSYEAIFRKHYENLKSLSSTSKGQREALLTYVITATNSFDDEGSFVLSDVFDISDADDYDTNNYEFQRAKDIKYSRYFIRSHQSPKDNTIIWSVLMLVLTVKELVGKSSYNAVHANILKAVVDSITRLSANVVHPFSWYFLALSPGFYGLHLMDQVAKELLSTCQVGKLQTLQSLVGYRNFRSLFKNILMGGDGLKFLFTGGCRGNLEFLHKLNLENHGLYESVSSYESCNIMDWLIDDHKSGLERDHLFNYFSIDKINSILSDCLVDVQRNDDILAKIVSNQFMASILSTRRFFQLPAIYETVGIISARCIGCMYWFLRRKLLLLDLEISDFTHVINDFHTMGIPFEELGLFEDANTNAAVATANRDSFVRWSVHRRTSSLSAKFNGIWEFLKNESVHAIVPEMKRRIFWGFNEAGITDVEHSLLQYCLAEGSLDCVEKILNWTLSSSNAVAIHFRDFIYPMLIENCVVTGLGFPSKSVLNHAWNLAHQMVIERFPETQFPPFWNILRISSPFFRFPISETTAYGSRLIMFVLTQAKLTVAAEIYWTLSRLLSAESMSILILRCMGSVGIDFDRSLLFYGFSSNLPSAVSSDFANRTTNYLNLFSHLKRSHYRQSLFGQFKSNPFLANSKRVTEQQSLFTMIGKLQSMVENKALYNQWMALTELRQLPQEIILKILRLSHPTYNSLVDGDWSRVFAIRHRCLEKFERIKKKTIYLIFNDYLITCFYESYEKFVTFRTGSGDSSNIEYQVNNNRKRKRTMNLSETRKSPRLASRGSRE